MCPYTELRTLLLPLQSCQVRYHYGWMPHNASFGFLDIPSAALGQIHF
jgi:hypothetical protein